MRTGLKQLHQTASAIDVENRRVILDLLEPSGTARVIDMGCGDGSFTRKIGERIGTAAISGIEVDEESVRLCEQKQLRILRADLNQALPLESASLDVVVSNQVIEHLWLTDLFLKEIHRVLKPGATPSSRRRTWRPGRISPRSSGATSSSQRASVMK